MKKPLKQLSGGARLKRAGKHPVLLGLWPDQIDLIRRAAEADGRPVSQFITHHILRLAEDFLEKSAKRA